MALTPGRKFVNSPIRIAANFQNDSGTDTDPTTIKVKFMGPTGIETTYTYGTDAALLKASTGDYYVDFTPDMSGLWHFRWVTTGTNTALAHEGSFRVTYSPFEDGATDAYRS